MMRKILLQDYGIDFDDHGHPIEAFSCNCGSVACRGKKQNGRKERRGKLILHILERHSKLIFILRGPHATNIKYSTEIDFAEIQLYIRYSFKYGAWFVDVMFCKMKIGMSDISLGFTVFPWRCTHITIFSIDYELKPRLGCPTRSTEDE